MRILVTGAAGFIGGYVVAELLRRGHEVVGVDNYSKYGLVHREHDTHPRYTLVVGDAKDERLMRRWAADCDQIVAGAAMIGGISYFHRYAYDLLAENERILATTFDVAIEAFKAGTLKKINVLSSSMVFENTQVHPTPEGDEKTSPPPTSTYGFQKLACEYFAHGAHQQYGLPYTIVRPFNCVGVGEGRASRAEEVLSGNVRLAMSHVLPDLAAKVLKGQDPLVILGEGHQVRCYTHGSDVARGIVACVENPAATDEDFNISTPRATEVLELARLIWDEVHQGRIPFRYECEAPFPYDVQFRLPSTEKAKRLLGFEAKVSLEDSVREVVAWIRGEIAAGRF
jgi:nucleoside-diphosphate-sugar epimerase